MADKLIGDSVNAAMDTGKRWLKALFKRFPQDATDEPPRTKKLVIYDAHGEILTTVDVPEDDGDTRGGQRGIPPP